MFADPTASFSPRDLRRTNTKLRLCFPNKKLEEHYTYLLDKEKEKIFKRKFLHSPAL